MSNRTAVHQLEADFADAMQRLYTVGNGLARLRTELDLEQAPQASAPTPLATPPVPASAAMTGGPAPLAHPTAGHPAGPPAAQAVPGPASAPGTPSAPAQPWSPFPALAEPAEPWYRREGRVTAALAVTGAVITMAGVAMLLVLAVQHGWFGPVARVTAGGVLAGLLVALGVRGGETDLRTPRVGARVGSAPVALVATGVAAAYLDVVAMTAGYDFVGPAAGLVLAGVLALGGLHLARRWDSELLAVLTVGGAAFLAPVVAQDFTWVVSAFLAVLCLTAWWAGGTTPRPTLTLVRVLPVTFSLLSAAVVSQPEGLDTTGHLVVATVVLLATVVTSAVSVGRSPSDVTASVALALTAVGLGASAMPMGEPTRTLVLAGAAAVLLLAATALSRRPLGPVSTHLVATAGAAGTVAAVLTVVSGAPERFVGTGLLLLAVGYLAVAGSTRARTTVSLAGGATVVALLAWLGHPVAVLTLGGALGHDLVVGVLDSVLAGGLVVVGVWAVAAQRGLSKDVRRIAAFGAWVTGLAASATALVSVATLLGERVGATSTGFTVGHAAATVTWMLAAAWLLLRGLDRSGDSDLVLRSGLLLSGLSVAKLFLYDLSALSGIVRSVAFIVTGLLLLATGTMYARAWERRRPAA